MEEKFAKIDAMTEEVNELKEQLYQLKENVKCPKCGAYNHSDDVYCSKCGERIYNVNSDDTDSYDDDEVVIINAKNLKQKRINYMSGRFDKFFDYAYEKGRDIAKKFHGNKGDKMDKKGMNIESYDGQDAFYTGTDEEYEEFLKNVDVKTDNDADAEPVENTQRINLNETINIQSVIDKFKKKSR